MERLKQEVLTHLPPSSSSSQWSETKRHRDDGFPLWVYGPFCCLSIVSGLFTVCFTHCADLLPLSVQFCLLIGLLEATSLSAFRHLDAVLEGSPAGTNFIKTRTHCVWPACQSLSVRTVGCKHLLGQCLLVVHVIRVLLLSVKVPAAQRTLFVPLKHNTASLPVISFRIN